MPERDWQKDWEMCRKVASKPWTIQRQRIVSPFLDASEEIVSIGPIEAACTCGDPRAASFLVVDEDIARFVAQAHPALSYWLQRVRELEADIAWLLNEYGESNEPMSQDALGLKKRCLILKERDELRKERDELLQRIREYEEIIRESKEHVRKLMDENERLKVTKELWKQGFPVRVQTLRDVTWDDLAKLEIENMRLKDKIKELRAEILALRKLRREGKQ
jgi:hypothetical protein